MGTLVFQATLGGSVNLIGPNTASTINFTLPSADGSSGQALTTNGSGTLSFGTLAIGGGGTGQTTANAAFNALAPSQTGNSGKYLTTDGTNTSWATNAGGDVTGPSSATANGIVLFNSTTGKLIKDSAASDGLIYGITVGRGAGAVSTNTAVGASALAANTTGFYNTGIGINALNAVVTANSNVALGAFALRVNTASNNTGVGSESLQANTSGGFNTALGNYALFSNTTASNNTAVGYQAGYTNTTGTYLTAVGFQAGYSSNASEQTFIGYQAGYATTGPGNTFVGRLAGYNSTTGAQSTYIGDGAGFSITTGSKNTIIGNYNGNQGGLDIRTASNYIVLSDGDGNPRGVFDGSGNFMVAATTTANYTTGFSVGDATSTKTFVRIGHNTTGATYSYVIFGFNASDIGNIAQNSAGTAVAYNTTSDYRLKENIAPMTGALAKVALLKPCTYTWKAAPEEVGEGFIAHELAEVCPHAVTGEKDAVDEDGNPKYQGIDTSFLVATLTAAIQELKAEFDAYKATHP